jgi:hypothetical protein
MKSERERFWKGYEAALYTNVIPRDIETDEWFADGWGSGASERYHWFPLYVRAIPYAEYLKTDHWKRLRKTALIKAEFRCQLCNKATELHVHHRTYERLGEEKDSDIIALCADCHAKFHGVQQ